MPKVHNKYHKTAPKEAVYVGRGSPYGNPFVIGKDGDREEVLKKFKNYLSSNPDLIDKVKSNLKGKDLVCFCKPKACHADLLLEVANSEN